jgi:hypothetical protein
MVAVDTNGYAVPASATAALRVVGRADAQADNSSGDAGDIAILVSTAITRIVNTSPSMTRASIGNTVFVVDDQTISLDDSSGTRPAAGRLVDWDSSGGWVAFNTEGSNGGTGAVSTTDLADLSVTEAKLANLNVTTGKIADDDVTGDKIPDDAISLEHLDDGISPAYKVHIANISATEDDADGVITVTHSGVAATDIVTASVLNTTNGSWLANITASQDQIVFNLNGPGGAGTRIYYAVMNATN